MAELSFPDPPLCDRSIRLRPLRDEDVPAIVAACSDALSTRFLHQIPVPYTADDARGWLATQKLSRLSGRRLDLAVAELRSDRLLGAIGFEPNFGEGRAEIGYWLAPSARGAGYMTAAVRLLCTYLFERLELGRVELTNDPLNVASQGVAARCGFVQEGYLRAHILDRRSGERRDSLVWGLVRG